MGMLLAYNLLWIIGMILAFPWVAISIITSRKRRKTVLQRLGITVFARTSGAENLCTGS